MNRERADQLLAVGMEATSAYGRPELTARLQRRRERLRSTTVRVVVLGEFKAGKSTLVNAVLGAELCPTDDDVATAVPTIVRHGPEAAAAGLVDTGDGVRRVPFPFEERAARIREGGDVVEHVGLADETDAADGEGPFSAVELSIPRKLLATGLELVDAPGVGGLRSAHTAAAIAAVDDAEAALFVTDAARELTGPELAALDRLARRCPNVLVVMTRIDLFPEWRRILDIDEGHLEQAGLGLAVLPVSSALRFRAIERRDDAIDRESGFAELVSILRDDVAGQAELLAVDRAATDLLDVVDDLIGAFELERSALADPEAAAALEAELADTAERAEQLKSRAARWQTTLNDGVNDLTADVDHDLRARVRAVGTEAGDRIGDLDPRQSWDEFTPWLEQRMADELLANQELLRERTGELATRVLDHFGDDRAAIQPAGFAPVAGPGAPMGSGETTVGALDLDTGSPVRQTLGALRGGYSGLTMFGMLSGLAGIPIATPVLAGIGLLLGAKQVREERARQLKAHRQQAQVSIRKYVDEVTFVAGKATRDSIKGVQRALRDHCTAEARETEERVKRSLADVRQARAEGDPSARIAGIDAELRRLAAFRAEVEAELDAEVDTGIEPATTGAACG